MEPNYDRIRKASSLWAAWGVVRHAALQSMSAETAKSAEDFRRREIVNIRRIGDQLRDRRFAFLPARGIPCRRPGKKPRPIVVAPIENRIVQRAVLDEVQSIPGLRRYIKTPHSFGGIEGRGRCEAIAAVQKAMEDGATYFIRSDIREFFTRIPRQSVVASLSKHLDPIAADLLEKATAVELANGTELGALRELFPTEEVGVAQGLCLSPLMGNVLLHDFDEKMNQRDIRCVRYIDDFILLGRKRDHVFKAFDACLELLRSFGMGAYDPRVDDAKAEHGPTTGTCDFLGCLVQRGQVRPNRKAADSLLRSVDQVLGGPILPAAEAYDARTSLPRVLYKLDNLVRGWRDSFGDMCAPAVFCDIDRALNKRFEEYMGRFRSAFRAAKADDRRLLLGVARLTDPSPARQKAEQAKHTPPSAI